MFIARGAVDPQNDLRITDDDVVHEHVGYGVVAAARLFQPLSPPLGRPRRVVLVLGDGTEGHEHGHLVAPAPHAHDGRHFRHPFPPRSRRHRRRFLIVAIAVLRLLFPLAAHFGAEDVTERVGDDLDRAVRFGAAERPRVGRPSAVHGRAEGPPPRPAASASAAAGVLAAGGRRRSRGRRRGVAA